MSQEDGLVYCYLMDGKGGGRPGDWSLVDDWRPEDGLLWMHLDYKSQNAQDWLREKSGLNALTVESLLDEETRPRNVLSSEGLFLILRVVNSNPGSDPEDMVALWMFFSENRIMTVRHQRVVALQKINEAIEAGRGPESMGDFLVMITERVADRMGDVVEDLDDQVDMLEDSVLIHESYQLRPHLLEVRRKTIQLRRYIAPQRDVLGRLLYDRLPWVDDLDRLRLREVVERTARFVEEVDSARERATIIQEELSNRLSEQMNKAMYILSIVTTIFLPLGLLTGLLGINVGGIPGAESKWAFPIVTLILAAIAAALIGWFKKTKWL